MLGGTIIIILRPCCLGGIDSYNIENINRKSQPNRGCVLFGLCPKYETQYLQGLNLLSYKTTLNIKILLHTIYSTSLCLAHL